MRAVRPFLDFVSAGLACWVLWSATPVGALTQLAVRHALGETPPHLTLASYFHRESLELFESELDTRSPIKSVPIVSTSTEAATPSMVQYELAVRAIHMTSDILGPHVIHSLRELGLGDELTSDALEKGLAQLVGTLGTEELALAALVVGPAKLQRALARASRVGAPLRRWSTVSRFLSARDRQEPAVRELLAARVACGFGSPLAGDLRLTSGFGLRVHPILGTEHRHRGVDFSAVVGTPILAVAPGQVTRVREDPVNGRMLEIEHGHGVSTVMCHADEISVQEGELVSRGQRVATSGNTGRSTGPHLHFQVEMEGVPVDPAPYLGLEIPSGAISLRSLFRRLSAWL